MTCCRHCHAPLVHTVVDLGHQPASNAYLTADRLTAPEPTAPLRVYVCDTCWLVQLPAHHAADALFTADYAYFSSVSSTWVAHARRYVAAMIDRFTLGPASFVVEVASNDGYLLQFVKAAGIPCLGIEPTASTAAAARTQGIETRDAFFGADLGRTLATTRCPADLIVANNVVAHVPDIDDFAAGFAALLAPDGVATVEFPHLMTLIDGAQFDTIYHEHYSYLSLAVVARIFAAQGLRVFDVEELATHGGSLRVYLCQQAATTRPTTPHVAALLARETASGLQTLAYYGALQARAERVRDDLRAFLHAEAARGRRVAGYGAAAKGNTLLNFASVTPDLLAFVCDAAPSKIGRYLPGSRIPILAPSALAEHRPDTVLILPWNLRDEIIAQHGETVRSWDGRFGVAVPTLEVL